MVQRNDETTRVPRHELEVDNERLRNVVRAFKTEFHIKFPPEYLPMYWSQTAKALDALERSEQ